MLFGLTRGELLLTAAIFVMVYGAVFVPRLGEKLGVFLVTRHAKGRPDDADDGRK